MCKGKVIEPNVQVPQKMVKTHSREDVAMDWITYSKTQFAILCTLALMFGLPLFGIFGVGWILLYSPYRLFLLPYFIWMYIDRDIALLGGRRIKALDNLFILRWLRQYFPIKLVKTAELDPSKNYIMGYHPHGVLTLGLQGNFYGNGNNKLFPGIKTHIMTMNQFFHIPFFRELPLSWGVVSVAKESINFLMGKKGGGNAAALVPGGIREALYSKPGTDVVYLKKRKGFVKLAIQNGASLVPIYSFGETDLFDQPGKWTLKFQEIMWTYFGFFPFILLGKGIFRSWFRVLPHRVPVTTVVGAPISVDKIENPSQKDIDHVHQKYMKALTDLYYKHREEYGNPSSELIIV